MFLILDSRIENSRIKIKHNHYIERITSRLQQLIGRYFWYDRLHFDSEETEFEMMNGEQGVK